MRICDHCQHSFEESQSPGQCPKCGQQFTISDVGAMTIDFGSATVDLGPPPSTYQPPGPGVDSNARAPDAPLSDASLSDEKKTVTASAFAGGQTIDLGPAQPVSASSAAPEPPAKPATKTDHDIGMTIQAGKFIPSAAEIAEALSTEGDDNTAEWGSQDGGASKLHDMTMMWDAGMGSSIIGNVGGSSGSKSGNSVGRPPGGGSSIVGSKGLGSVSGKSLTGAAALLPSYGESLEQSLVIQPRILREEAAPVNTLVERTDYNLLKKLGEGGMGVVYAARQASIRRTVALKMLKKEGAQKTTQREKFLAEAVITGDLEHPNIVPIYDLGRDEGGAIFYAMKHVQGTPWDKLIDKKSLTENIEILMKVADGVAFAHSRGVIHRDLKPENVMLGDFGEVLVMDWGLALAIDNPPETFSMGGTPAYMAPEMAFGPVENIGFASDVYLLGAILYEVITGGRPHAGSTLTRCLMSASKNEIVPTQKTGELVNIALKAMATDPRQRYQNVPEFQDAIRDYQSHTESIALGDRAEQELNEARQQDNYDAYARALFGFQEAVALWAGNSRAGAGALEAATAYAESALRKGDYDLGLSLLDAAESANQGLIKQLNIAKAERESRQRRLRTARRIGVVLAASILVIVSGAFFWIRKEAERARAAEVVAKAERQEALRQKGVAEKERTRAIASQTEAENQRKFADEQRKVAEEQRAEAIAARLEEQKQRLAADQAREQEAYEGYIARLGLAAAKIEENAFDHAASLLAACPPELRHWEWGRLSYLCNREVESYDCGQPLEALAVSPDGKRFATGGWGSEVRLVSLETGKSLGKIETGASYVFALAFSPDGSQIAVGSNAKPEYLHIYEAASGKHVRSLPGHKDAVLSVAWSRDGGQLLTGSYDHDARLWNVRGGTSRQFSGHDWWVWSASFAPDEKRILTASQDGSVMVWDVNSGEPSPPFLEHRGPVYSATFAPDGQSVASAGYDKRVLVWRPDLLHAEDLEKVLAGKTNAVPAAFATLEGHTGSVRTVRFSNDGGLLLSAGHDNAICVWDAINAKLVKKLRGHASRVSSIAFTPLGDRVLSASYDQQAKLWSISQYEEMRVLGGRVLKGHRDAILGAAFSPNGDTVVTASRDRSAVAWDVGTGQALRSYKEGHAYLASRALFLPGGRQVLTSAADNTCRIWDVATGVQQLSLEGTGSTATVALPSSGEWIVTGSDEREVKVWDRTGRLLHRFQGFTSEVTALAISTDDREILAGDAVGRLRLIRADTGAEVWQSRGHSRGLTAVAFLPGGKRVLSASLDNSVGQWNAATGEEIRSLELKHPDAVTSLVVSLDGRWALTVCADKQVRLWNIERARVERLLPVGEDSTVDVAFAPDGRRALAVSSENRLRLFDLETGKEVDGPNGKSTPFLDLSASTLVIWSASFSETGRQLLTVGGAEAHLWDADSAKLQLTFSPQSAVSSVQFSRDGKQLVTSSWDNAARIWNAANGATLAKLGGVHTRFVNASAFSPDGTCVLTASDDRTIRMWQAETGELLGTFSGHEGRVTDVCFSTDGELVLSSSEDKTARIWDATSFKVKHILNGHTQAVLCARFSFNDRTIITGGDDTTARLWNTDTGESLPIVLAGHTASVTSVAFTPDGKRALTGSKDITTKVWDPATGKEILTLTGHSQEITTVAVSPDGGRVLTGSRDGTAIVWLTKPWQMSVPKSASR